MTRVAIFVDTDLHENDDLTATLRAILRHAPNDLHARVFTASELPADTDDYFATASLSVAVPWSRQRRVFWPRLGPLRRQLRSGADVIHIATAGPIGLAGRWLAKQSGVPVVGSIHTGQGDAWDAMRLRTRLCGFLNRLTLRTYDGCDPILAPSRDAAISLAARGLTNLHVWEHGVDTSTFAPTRASASHREAWHVDHRRPAIVFPLASLTKREAALIEPIRRRLNRHALSHQFVFIGPDRVGVDVHAIDSDGIFIEDLSDDRLAVAMASADLCVFTGASDHVAEVVLKAQACGLPAIVPDAGAAVEHIVPGHTGCVSRAGDVDDIVSAVIGLLRNPERRAEMGRAARVHAAARDWSAMLQPLHTAWRTASQARDLPMSRAHRTSTNEAA